MADGASETITVRSLFRQMNVTTCVEIRAQVGVMKKKCSTVYLLLYNPFFFRDIRYLIRTKRSIRRRSTRRRKYWYLFV